MNIEAASELENSALFGTKWSIRILAALEGRVVRFGALKCELEGVSQKALSASLKLLERDGLVDRRHYPVIPPRVEYRLTETGTEMAALLAALRAVALARRETVSTARRRFDERAVL